MQLSQRVMALKPSATLAVNALALELQAKGQKVLSLSLGEPDFPTPEPIRAAAKAAIDSGFTKYTAESGIVELRQAAAAYFNDTYLDGSGAGAEHILIANGGKQCLYNLFMAVLNPGDEALIPAPYWVSYPPMVELCGAKAVAVPSGAERGFKVTPEDLEQKYTPKTRLCILNSPSNPTGVVYSRAEVEALAKWAVAHDILLVADEIYDRLVYAPAVMSSFAPWWKKHPEHFAVVNGVAKSFSMTGWRVGYLLAHPDLIKAAGKLQGQSTSNVCSISQKAAFAALTGSFAPLEEMRAAFERRRDLVMQIISAWPDVLCPTPQGAFYAFPDLHKHYTKERPDSAVMCKYLLEKAGVALVPGEAFGDDRCVRLSYATSDQIITQALERVAKALF